MIDYALKDLLLRSDTDKQLRIRSDIGNITNSDLESGTFTLNESLFDDDYLRFGACIPSSISFTVHNTVLPLINKKLTLDLMLNGKTTERLDIGEYFVTADTPTADRKKRTVTAYDALQRVVNTDVAKWYNSFFATPNTSKTLKKFRNSFFAHFGITQEEQDLVNDSIMLTKTIEPEELSGKTVIESICEINGCFGHIGRNGKMKYIYLNPSIEGLYPSNELYPSNDLFPRSANGELLDKQTYIPPCEYESYIVKSITGLQIRKEENDVGATVGTDENQYVIQDNFLLYGKSDSELNTIANNILSKIVGLEYRPFSTKAKGNPCLEVGDAVRLNTSEQKIESYIMQRTIKGVQQMFDTYTAKGRQTKSANLNSTKAQIKELQGKTNKLIRTVDETRSEIENVEKGLHSEIVQTAGEIRSEVSDTANGLQSQISQNAQQIQLRITAGEAEYLINLAIDGIELKADQIRLEGFTTVNGGFSIDLNGNAVLTSSDGKSEAKVSSSGFEVSSKTAYQKGLYTTNGIIYSSPSGDMIAVVSNYDRLQIGTNGFPTDILGKTITLNGSTPITSDNISSYLSNYDVIINSLLERVVSLENQIASLNTNQIYGDFRTGNNGSYVALKDSTGDKFLATTEWVMQYVTKKLEQ